MKFLIFLVALILSSCIANKDNYNEKKPMEIVEEQKIIGDYLQIFDKDTDLTFLNNSLYLIPKSLEFGKYLYFTDMSINGESNQKFVLKHFTTDNYFYIYTFTNFSPEYYKLIDCKRLKRTNKDENLYSSSARYDDKHLENVMIITSDNTRNETFLNYLKIFTVDLVKGNIIDISNFDNIEVYNESAGF